MIRFITFILILNLTIGMFNILEYIESEEDIYELNFRFIHSSYKDKNNISIISSYQISYLIIFINYFQPYQTNTLCVMLQ